jgi:cysteine desulfuration protein SufE
MTIAEEELAIVDEFRLYQDWADKYEYIIELGRELPLISESYKTPEYLIKGCQSQVWLRADEENGVIHYTADSDAIITKGIISLLIRVLSGHTPTEILEADLGFLKEIGLMEHLSPTRANGLVSMIRQMKLYALAIREKND